MRGSRWLPHEDAVLDEDWDTSAWSAQEIETAWDTGATFACKGHRDRKLNNLLAQYSNWRANDLPRKLQCTDVAGLVMHVERTGSIGRDALEDARDDDAPKKALVRLLLGAPKFVAKQRGVYLQHCDKYPDWEQRPELEEHLMGSWKLRRAWDG